MGTTKAALTLAAVLSCAWLPTRAEAKCVGASSHGPFPSCFDLGNRAWIAGSLDGVSAGLDLRHRVLFVDEPELVWKLSHRFAHIHSGGKGGGYAAALYRGRFVRHARDGHLVVPIGRPRKVFLPFDIGAEADVGSISSAGSGAALDLAVVRAAPLIELLRSPGFRRRLALGPVARWDAVLDTTEWGVMDHRVSPFSMVMLSAYAESSKGLSAVELDVEGGREWSRSLGWRWEVRAAVRVERTLIALNDRPLSIFVGARYRHTSSDLVGQLGVRFAFAQRGDARAQLAR